MLMLLSGCGHSALPICKDSEKIKQIYVYSYELNSEMRITPTIEDLIRSAPHRDTIINPEVISYVCDLISDLPASKSRVNKFNIRAVCILFYDSNKKEYLEIDTYGRMRFNDIMATGSYRLIDLLGINCLSFETR